MGWHFRPTNHWTGQPLPGGSIRINACSSCMFVWLWCFSKGELLRMPCEHYDVPFEEAELRIFFQLLCWKIEDGHAFSSLMEVLDTCPADVFTNMSRLLKITLPITTCFVERLFSTVGRVKSALRSSRTALHLNNLSLLSFEWESVDSLDYDDIIDICNNRPQRLHLVM